MGVARTGEERDAASSSAPFTSLTPGARSGLAHGRCAHGR